MRLRAQFNGLFRLRIKGVGDIVEAPSQRLLEFVEVWQLLRITRNYEFIWQQLQNIALTQACSLHLQTGEQP